MLGFWFAVSAFAQVPGLPPSLAALGAQSNAPVRFVLEDSQSVRFFDSIELDGPSLLKGEKVVLIFEKDGKSRVMKGPQFGWVSTDSLSLTPVLNELKLNVPNPNLPNLPKLPTTP